MKKNIREENIIPALTNWAFLALLLLVPPFKRGKSLWKGGD
jgi:hypothetical protein